MKNQLNETIEQLGGQVKKTPRKRTPQKITSHFPPLDIEAAEIGSRIKSSDPKFVRSFCQTYQVYRNIESRGGAGTESKS